MSRFMAVALMLPAGCITFTDPTIAPVPCVPVIFPTQPFDLNPRMPADGVCIRARIQEKPE